jgi:hypothetical protein
MPILKFTSHFDVREFVNECSSDEVHDLIEFLIERGDLVKVVKEDVVVNENIKKSEEEQLFENALNKLHGKWNMISNLDMSIILELSEKTDLKSSSFSEKKSINHIY